MSYKCGHQLCGGWSVEVAMQDALREENGRKKAIARQIVADERKKLMLIFVKYMRETFSGTIAEEPCERLIVEWAKHDYNKVPNMANFMVLNILDSLGTCELLAEKWEFKVRKYCEETGLQPSSFYR